MNKNTEIAIGIALVVVLVGALYWHEKQESHEDNAVFMEATTTLPSGDGTTDKDLEADTAAIDAQLNGLSGDQQTVDSSVNDSAQVQ